MKRNYKNVGIFDFTSLESFSTELGFEELISVNGGCGGGGSSSSNSVGWKGPDQWTLRGNNESSEKKSLTDNYIKSQEMNIQENTPTLVVILRKDDGYGNAFDSERYVYKEEDENKKIIYNDMCGNNCKDAAQAAKYNGMTLPDGEYYLTSDWLIPQSDGTYNSGSYANVYRLQTNDENIPKDIRDKINSDWYLFHANQQIGGTPTNTPGSAGCAISKGGQEGHDIFMSNMIDGVTDVSSIKVVIHSYSNETGF